MSFFSQFDAFHEQAIKATGLNDFGSADYVEPMKLLLSDYDKYSQFSPEGKQMTSALMVGPLVGRLLAQAGIKSHPEFASAAVKQPLIIIGMMRTGTTVLHRLISQDPENQSLPFWLGSTPMPRPSRDTWEKNPWYQQTAQWLDQLYQAYPNIKSLHPMLADQPDECHLVVSQTFWSVPMATTAIVPEYDEWCTSADVRFAYQYYRKVLGLIAGGSTKRWVLKDPSHLWGLDALLETFPDACVVFTHRDISKAMGSMASLTYQGRRIREPDIDLAQHIKLEFSLWGGALDKAEQVRRKRDPAQFFDVHINQLQSDPMGTVELIYRHFNLPLPKTSHQAMAQYISIDPRGGHGTHHFKEEDFGFTAQEACASTGSYYDRYVDLYGGN